MYRANPDELDFEDELAGAVSLLEGAVGKRIKKKLKKAVKVVATGGLAAVPMAAKKIKKTKLAKKVKAVAKKAGAALGVKVAIAKPKPAPKAPPKPKPAAAKPSVAPKAVVKVSPAAAKTFAKVASIKPSDCRSMDEMAALVTAQLVAKLGPPLSEANKRLRLAELQRTATYEHNRLMTDSEFRRLVLDNLMNKAANGNTSCERTIRVLMGR